MATTKVLMKLVNEKRDRVEWTHVCYVDNELYNKYIEHFDLTTSDFNETMARWIKENFNVTLVISTKRDLEVVKGLLREHYKAVYPDLYRDDGNEADRQGWVRLFVTTKMKEDLGPYGE